MMVSVRLENEEHQSIVDRSLFEWKQRLREIENERNEKKKINCIRENIDELNKKVSKK